MTTSRACHAPARHARGNHPGGESILPGEWRRQGAHVSGCAKPCSSRDRLEPANQARLPMRMALPAIVLLLVSAATWPRRRSRPVRRSGRAACRWRRDASQPRDFTPGGIGPGGVKVAPGCGRARRQYRAAGPGQYAPGAGARRTGGAQHRRPDPGHRAIVGRPVGHRQGQEAEDLSRQGQALSRRVGRYRGGRTHPGV